MITRSELLNAIEECENKENPVFHDCEKLSVFYNLYDKMYGNADMMNSFDAPAIESTKLLDVSFSDSDFAKLIDGKNADDVLSVIDELMNILQVTQPNMYNAVINKLQSI